MQHNIKEFLKSFNQLSSSGFENHYNLQHCKINILGLREIEMKDSQVTVPLRGQYINVPIVVKRPGLFPSCASPSLVVLNWIQREQTTECEEFYENLADISEGAVHNFFLYFAGQHSIIWPHLQHGFGKSRIMVLQGRKW